MATLFRPEVVVGRQQHWLGSVQLTRPPPLALLTWGVVGVVAAVVAFLSLGEYTHKVRVAGYLAPSTGVIRLVPTQSATVLESHAAEGQAVRKGDVLFVLSVGQATLTGETQAAVQQTLAARERSLEGDAQQRAMLQQAELAGIDQQLADMARELASMVAERELQQQRVALAETALTELVGLQRQNFISASRVRGKEEELLGLKAQLQGLDRQRAVQLRGISALQAQRRELPLRHQARQGEITRDLAALAQQSAESEARQRLVVRAPQDGVVTGVMAEPGQSVSPAVALASLVPANARLQASLFAPSSAVGFLRPHQAVQLRFQAFPYQKFGHQRGEVMQVSRTPLQGAELGGLPVATGAANEPMYRITVALDKQSVMAYGQPQPLVSGMQIDADVLLEHRRLIEWIFEPLLGVAGRV